MPQSKNTSIATCQRQEQSLAPDVTEEFERSLKQLDKQRGWSLTTIWRECMRMHDENAVLRSNMQQMQTMLQEHYHEWADFRKRLSILTDGLDKERIVGRKNLKPEERQQFLAEMNAILAMSDKSARLITHISTTIKELKKEVRMTEFQSRYFFHVNLVQQFMAGLTAILFKHLQSSEKLDQIILEMRRLAQLFPSRTIDMEETDEDAPKTAP